MHTDFRLPVALFPTAAQDHLSEGMVADYFRVDVRYVRAMYSFTKDLLISRAIEMGFIPRDWTPKSSYYSDLLDELSRAILGHWSKLLTETEREERRHVQFVLRTLRRRYTNREGKRHVV
jgi:ATP-dependent RNA circularization protein (DNA/RNA ligase family)